MSEGLLESQMGVMLAMSMVGKMSYYHTNTSAPKNPTILKRSKTSLPNSMTKKLKLLSFSKTKIIDKVKLGLMK